MKGAVTYTSLCESLLKAVPELEELYPEEVKAWAYDTPSPHILFGSQLADFIRNIVSKQQDDRVRGVFAFIEDLATNGDKETLNVIEVSLLESLLGEKCGLEMFASHFGSNTKKLAINIADRWKLDANLLKK